MAEYRMCHILCLVSISVNCAGYGDLITTTATASATGVLDELTYEVDPVGGCEIDTGIVS